jgi:hypothetical protein
MSTTKKNPPCVNGLIISIKSTLDLWSDMKKNGSKYLLTSRLNQDPLENLFSILRRRSGFNSNPTASQFRQNLQSVINMTLMKSPVTANCEPDADTSLLSPEEVADSIKKYPTITADASEDLVTTEYQGEEEDENTSREEILIEDEITDSEAEPDDDESDEESYVEESDESDVEYEEFSYDYEKENVDLNAKISLEDTATAYVGGYLAKKVDNKFKCDQCSSNLVKKDSYLDERDVQILHRDYGVKQSEDVKHLKVPTTWWFKITKEMNILVTSYLKNHIHTRNINNRIVEHICNIKNVKMWLESHETCRWHQDYVINLFVRMRLHSTVKRVSTAALVIAKKGRKRTADKNTRSEQALKKHRGGNDDLSVQM